MDAYATIINLIEFSWAQEIFYYSDLDRLEFNWVFQDRMLGLFEFDALTIHQENWTPSTMDFLYTCMWTLLRTFINLTGLLWID